MYEQMLRGMLSFSGNKIGTTIKCKCCMLQLACVVIKNKGLNLISHPLLHLAQRPVK